MIDAPRRHENLSTQVVHGLRAEIESGRWSVGMRIPSEHKLVEQLGVSRATLRQALSSLVHLGLLEPKVGDGTYVRASNELESILLRRASVAAVDDVYDLRAILEEYAAGRAALRRTAADVDRLYGLAAQIKDAARSGDMADVAQMDGEFHLAVIAASHNELLKDVYAPLGMAISAFLGSLDWDESVASDQADLHMRLVEAIEAGDETAARVISSSVVCDTHARAGSHTYRGVPR